MSYVGDESKRTNLQDSLRKFSPGGSGEMTFTFLGRQAWVGMSSYTPVQRDVSDNLYITDPEN